MVANGGRIFTGATPHHCVKNAKVVTVGNVTWSSEQAHLGTVHLSSVWSSEFQVEFIFPLPTLNDLE